MAVAEFDGVRILTKSSQIAVHEQPNLPEKLRNGQNFNPLHEIDATGKFFILTCR